MTIGGTQSKDTSKYPQNYPQIPPEVNELYRTLLDDHTTEKPCMSMTYQGFCGSLRKYYWWS